MKARVIGSIVLLVLGLALLGCGPDNPAQPPLSPTTVASPSIAGPTATVPPTVMPSPTTASGAVTLTRDGTGWRVETGMGALAFPIWLGPTRLAVGWAPDAATAPTAFFLLDLGSGQVTQLPAALLPFDLVPNATGRQAIIRPMQGTEAAAMRFELLQLPSGTRDTIFALDPAVPQWTAPADRRWDYGTAPLDVDADWIGPDAVMLTLSPLDDRNMWTWGKVLLADTATRQVRVLGERSQVAAVFPDGSVLVRSNWVDGPLDFLAPPYTGKPLPVAPGGPWTWGGTSSGDGRHAAWFELAPPPGDWSDRLPHECCSGDPGPSTQALVIWDRASGTLARYPVSGVRWPWDMTLHWRRDNVTLLYTADPLTDTEHTNLYQMTLDGRSTLLANPAWPGPITVYSEMPDGTLYLGVGSGIGSNGSQLIRLHPDGHMDVLREDVPIYAVDARGRLIDSVTGPTTTVEDLSTGAILHLPFMGAALSPDGRWAAGQAADRLIRVAPIP